MYNKIQCLSRLAVLSIVAFTTMFLVGCGRDLEEEMEGVWHTQDIPFQVFAFERNGVLTTLMDDESIYKIDANYIIKGGDAIELNIADIVLEISVEMDGDKMIWRLLGGEYSSNDEVVLYRQKWLTMPTDDRSPRGKFLAARSPGGLPQFSGNAYQLSAADFGEIGRYYDKVTGMSAPLSQFDQAMLDQFESALESLPRCEGFDDFKNDFAVYRETVVDAQLNLEKSIDSERFAIQENIRELASLIQGLETKESQYSSFVDAARKLVSESEIRLKEAKEEMHSIRKDLLLKANNRAALAGQNSNYNSHISTYLSSRHNGISEEGVGKGYADIETRIAKGSYAKYYNTDNFVSFEYKGRSFITANDFAWGSVGDKRSEEWYSWVHRVIDYDDLAKSTGRGGAFVVKKEEADAVLGEVSRAALDEIGEEGLGEFLSKLKGARIKLETEEYKLKTLEAPNYVEKQMRSLVSDERRSVLLSWDSLRSQVDIAFLNALTEPTAVESGEGFALLKDTSHVLLVCSPTSGERASNSFFCIAEVDVDDVLSYVDAGDFRLSRNHLLMESLSVVSSR